MAISDLAQGCASTQSPALGVQNCGKFKGLPKGFLFTETDIAVTGATLGTTAYFYDYMREWTQYSPNGRRAAYAMYPKIVNFAPTGGDVKLITEGFGAAEGNGINPYHEVYTILNGGECLYRQLLTLAKRDILIYKIDDTDSIFGTLVNGGSAEQYVRGYKCKIYVTMRENNGSNVGAILLTVVYTNTYEQEREKEFGIAIGKELPTVTELSIIPYAAASNPEFIIVNTCSGKAVDIAVASAVASALVSNGIAYLHSGNERLDLLIDSAQAVSDMLTGHQLIVTFDDASPASGNVEFARELPELDEWNIVINSQLVHPTT